jgi:hypothetical protein
MLLLLQAAAQQLPPINVTVQQPAGGMPEWVKILISAGTGALFGVLSNIAMEVRLGLYPAFAFVPV